ncbi:hypothetical protein [Planomicrobium okeanokoites]|uniref:hypothetical protein n=1 Tax=Planomicrobium okeanokoites TaxID=244 RepID=UPI000A069A22|nr:hypothetical protein [Planomicrobium okeanokoites]
MDMHFEQYDATREFFNVLGMIKLAVDFGVNKSDLTNVELFPAYHGTSVDVLEVFDTILRKVEGFETQVSGYSDEDHDKKLKEILLYTKFSETGEKVMKEFQKDRDLIIYQIDSERLDGFPFELAGNRINVDGCATMGKTPTGIVIVFALDYGEPDYRTALQEVLEHVKTGYETERK